MSADWKFCPQCATALQPITEVEDGGAKVRLRCPACRWTHWNNIGGRSERTNLEVVHTLCRVLDEARPGRRHADLIRHVGDRRGHDRRYAIDDTKIASKLGWKPSVAFEQGIRDTVQWYLANTAWVESVTSGAYRQWVEQQYPTLQRTA